MRYLYRQQWKSKHVSLSSIADWVRKGKYYSRVEAARGGGLPEEYAFTGERERQIMERNADYYELPNVISLFEDMFRKPQVGDEVLLLSPTEILKKLKVDPESRANATTLGTYLRRNGYGKGEGNNRRRYKLAVNL